MQTGYLLLGHRRRILVKKKTHWKDDFFVQRDTQGKPECRNAQGKPQCRRKLTTCYSCYEFDLINPIYVSQITLF